MDRLPYFGPPPDPDTAEDPRHLVIRGWLLRETSEIEALRLASEAELRWNSGEAGTEDELPWRGRIDLLRAEAFRLDGAPAKASALAASAREAAVRASDPILEADCRWTEALLAFQGTAQRSWEEAANQAIRGAEGAGDQDRGAYFRAYRARWRLFGGTIDTKEAEKLGAMATGLAPYSAAAVQHFTSSLTFDNGLYAEAIRGHIGVWETSKAAGMVHLAVTSAANVAAAFNNLNDQETSMKWVGEALELARPTGCAQLIGLCQLLAGNKHRLLRQWDLAEAALDEAIAFLTPAASRNFGMALLRQAELFSDTNRPGRTLDLLTRLEAEVPWELYQDAWFEILQTKAKACRDLDRLEEARAIMTGALEKARSLGAKTREQSALQILASLENSDDRSLELLEEALRTAESVQDFTPAPELLDALAAAHARKGNFTQAYGFATRSAQTKEAVFNETMAGKLQALELNHIALRAEADARHHKALELLGIIGQEITAELEQHAVIDVLSGHIRNLLEAPVFAIYLFDPRENHLDLVAGKNGDQNLPPACMDLDATGDTDEAQALRGRDILSLGPSEACPRRKSALFAPLAAGDRVLGLLTVESPVAGAYDEPEILVFRTLAAYTTIALDNARAYRDLGETRDKLVAQERFAALGSLVAGVAHELNTPLGNGLLMTSHLIQKIQELEPPEEMVPFLKDTSVALELVLRNLNTAASLVSSFKQVAVDRTSDQRRIFSLADTSRNIVATMTNGIWSVGHEITLDIPAEILLDGFPGPYGQVLTNLIQNSLVHGFEGKGKPGHMNLSARMGKNEQVEIRFSDDGAGIPRAHLSRVFEPFFTTRLGKGGSGLGLAICYNIVTQLLRGEISVESEVGHGACFILRIPRKVPE